MAEDPVLSTKRRLFATTGHYEGFVTDYTEKQI